MTPSSQKQTLGLCSLNGCLGIGTGHSRKFRFVRNRNLSQSALKIPGGFAKGSSEPSADTTVGARQQSSAPSKITISIVLELASPVNWVRLCEHQSRWVHFLELTRVTSSERQGFIS